jgi:hypothetical protein
LIGLALYLIDAILFAIENDSKVAGNFLAFLAVLARSFPIILLMYVIWKKPNLLTKISTVFWSIGSLMLSIILFFLAGFLILSNTLNPDIFSFNNFRFF